MNALILQHVPFEGPGSIGHWLDDEGADVQLVRLHAGELPPAPRGFDLICIMGGPMSVNDESRFPWMVREKEFVREAVAADASLLGVCLGAQMIANALGAKVTPNAAKEIGWMPVRGLHPAGEYFRLPHEQTVFHWHGEMFDLPPGSVLIASSPACVNQGFQLGGKIVGLQFHLEATPAGVWDLVENERADITPGPHVQSEEAILNPASLIYDEMHRTLASLLDYLTGTR